MKTPYYVIVETDKAYNNEKKITEDISIVVNTTIESVEHINRKATVLVAPDFTVLEKGDEVIIHHNIFRLRNGLKGVMLESDYLIEDNRYCVPPTEIFMYKRGDSDWEALDPYCFIKPIKAEEDTSLIKGVRDLHKGNLPHIGIIVYPNKEMAEKGLKKGDKVAFSKYSEYEFELNGEILYKMSTNDILAVF